MTCAVDIVFANCPQVLARKRVKKAAGRARGKDSGVETDMPLENAGEHFALVRRWRARVECASDIGGSIEVLTSRVEQHHVVVGELLTSLWDGTVVNDGSVAIDASDGRE